MATVKTIGGTTPDYATITAWEAAAPATLTDIWEGRCRPVAFEENVVIAGSTNESASLYKLLTFDPATSGFHDLDPEGGARVSGGAVGHLFQVDEDYFRAVGLNVHSWYGESAEAFRVNGDQCRIERSFFWGAMNSNADGIFLGTAFNYPATSAKLYVSNCVFVGLGRTAVHAQGDKAGTVYVYDCDVLDGVFGLEQTVGASAGYVALGDDRGDPPTSAGVTWHIKGTYSSTANLNGAPAFGKGAASSWGNSTNNGSSDSSAPGSNPQTSLAIASQFVDPGTMIRFGENTADDVNSVTEDSWLYSSNPTQNRGTDAWLDLDNSPETRTIIRFDLSSIGSTALALCGRIIGTLYNDPANNISYGLWRVLRNWTETGVTWNTYDGSNSWASAGADGSGDIEDTGSDGDTRGTFTTRSWTARGQDFGVGDVVSIVGGVLADWITDALRGNAPGANANDLEILSVWDTTSPTGNVQLDSSEGTDGERPYLQFRYVDSSNPLDLTPDTAGSLDGNGVNLSSDTDYPVSIDIFGNTRTAYDIGAVALATPVSASQACLAESIVSNLASTQLAPGEAVAAISAPGLAGDYPTDLGFESGVFAAWTTQEQGVVAQKDFVTVNDGGANVRSGFRAMRITYAAAGGDSGYHHYGVHQYFSPGIYVADADGRVTLGAWVLAKSGLKIGCRIVREIDGVAYEYDNTAEGGDTYNGSTGHVGGVVTADGSWQFVKATLPRWTGTGTTTYIAIRVGIEYGSFHTPTPPASGDYAFVDDVTFEWEGAPGHSYAVESLQRIEAPAKEEAVWNGSFETGDFEGWGDPNRQSPPSSAWSVVAETGGDGSYAAEVNLGQQGGEDRLYSIALYNVPIDIANEGLVVSALSRLRAGNGLGNGYLAFMMHVVPKGPGESAFRHSGEYGWPKDIGDAHVATVYYNTHDGDARTETTLAADAPAGATSVVLSDATDWSDGTDSISWIAFETETDQSDLPNAKVIRFLSRSGTTVNLEAPLPRAMVAGTRVRCHADGGTYTYGAYWDYSAIGATWTESGNTYVAGDINSLTNFGNKYRPGAKFISLFYFALSGDATDRIQLDDIRVSKVVDTPVDRVARVSPRSGNLIRPDRRDGNFDQWYNNGNGLSVTADEFVAPDGTTTAAGIRQTATVGANRSLREPDDNGNLFGSANAAGRTVTSYCFVKRVSGTDANPWVSLRTLEFDNTPAIVYEGGPNYLLEIGSWYLLHHTRTTEADAARAVAMLDFGFDGNGASNDNVFAVWRYDVFEGTLPVGGSLVESLEGNSAIKLSAAQVEALEETIAAGTPVAESVEAGQSIASQASEAETVPPIFARPDADGAGVWVDELGGTVDIFESIDEPAPANDSDWVESR